MESIVWRKALSKEITRCDHDCEEVLVWRNYKLVKYPDSYAGQGKWCLFNSDCDFLGRFIPNGNSSLFNWAREQIKNSKILD